MQGLYIHIPFCVSKCVYCDFASFAGIKRLRTPYLKALKREIILQKKHPICYQTYFANDCECWRSPVFGV